jgi:signal transduction histidine kinase
MAKLLEKHPYQTAAVVLACLLILLGGLAGWRYESKPHLATQKNQPGRPLQKVSARFHSEQQKLLKNSRALSRKLQNELEIGRSRRQLFRTMQTYRRLWGAVLYRGKKPIVWSGFSPKPPNSFHPSPKKNFHEAVVKQNNVLFWMIQTSFTLPDSDKTIPYYLFTAKRISQHNALPIGNNKEYNMLDGIAANPVFNINISIFKSLPAHFTAARILRSLSGDSVGVVYAVSRNPQMVIKKWKTKNRFLGTVYGLLCLVVIGVLVYLWLDELSAPKALLFQLVVVVIGWIVFYQVNIAQNWLHGLLAGKSPGTIASYQLLCNFLIEGVFFLLIAFTLRRKLKRFSLRFDANAYFYVLISAFCAGFINALAIVFAFRNTYHLIYTTTVPLLTLRVFPGTGMLLFYLAIGILFFALTLGLSEINQFLLRLCREHSKLVIILCCFGFIVGLFVIPFFGAPHTVFDWVFFISLIYFGLIYAISFSTFYFPRAMALTSPLRAAALFSFVIAIGGATVIYQAKKHRVDIELEKTIQRYTAKKDPQAASLTRTLLTRLQQGLKTVTDSTLIDSLPLVQTQFIHLIDKTMKNSNGLYSFDLQLINADDSVLVNYSNNLNTPQWMHQFKTRRLESLRNIQRSAKGNNHPVVQQPKLTDEAKYQTFYRGWIPLFGKHNVDPIAWILCSVYREHPDFNKPLRAVAAAQHYPPGRNSYFIEEYRDNRLIQKNYLGLRMRYPVYSRLTRQEQQAMQVDSMAYFTSRQRHHSYRNLLMKLPDGRVVKSSISLPGYQNILFLYFRLSFTLLVFGFILAVLARWAARRQFDIFGGNTRFQNRILDSFLLASLAFLILLVFMTHLAYKHQSKKLIQQQLYKKLSSLTAAVGEPNKYGHGAGSIQNIPLDSLAASLNVDASLYNNREWVKSTTPQIYQQHLLPAALPYPVYLNLFLRRKREAFTNATFSQRRILMGYRSILSNTGKPLAVAAIPTFVQSPAFNRQLLQTTSYLIILYIIIFAAFIIGTVFISRHLTKPLAYFREGLRTISKGNLDTLIPVTSNDEIGELAEAYNQMVLRLRKLQQELAETEREEAWQQMAQQVAHEIKNPLTPMKLNIQHLQLQLFNRDYSVDELKQKITHITQNLTDQIQLLNNIASDFSKFSKPIKKEDFVELTINELVHSVANLYENDERISMNVECRASGPPVYGIEDELRRVLINLVKNAREAIPASGAVTLRTYYLKAGAFIEVEDNGEGIAEKDKSQIFVPNFSTKSGGTGLGLAICKKVIESHGGSISFASIKGRGTTFVIKLPLGNSS